MLLTIWFQCFVVFCVFYPLHFCCEYIDSKGYLMNAERNGQSQKDGNLKWLQACKQIQALLTEYA